MNIDLINSGFRREPVSLVRLNHLRNGIIKFKIRLIQYSHQEEVIPEEEPTPDEPIEEEEYPPHYIERHLFITGIGLARRKASVNTFTIEDRDIKPSSYTVGFETFQVDKALFARKLLQYNPHLKPGTYTVGISDMRADDAIDLKKYKETTYQLKPGTYTVGISNIQHLGGVLTHKYQRSYRELPSGPCDLMITRIYGDKAIITNAT